MKSTLKLDMENGDAKHNENATRNTYTTYEYRSEKNYHNSIGTSKRIF